MLLNNGFDNTLMQNIFDYVDLGADIPLFLHQKDCLIRGKGDLIANIIFPKYHFLIVQPSFNCSTKSMYTSFKESDFDFNSEFGDFFCRFAP